ncbi:uncharacterized conserved small protein [Xenococcus sp. PCC 7305]|uniref:DUF2288 domain-containing protein n=1 Tax=Xenococcus sp. PCC 7305 TaxID=102125 RepID=UPI0002AC468D|nr:DUF2288 domain-containing protein [Xenococcus sp. PCC 7305]ELS05464.1 uncharacterized conserved small protein [Xenococcus sp. PCC 7305]
MSDIKEKLNQDIASVSWQDLLPHAKRDVLIVVANHLDLLDVSEAIALDKKDLVSSWIAQKLISKPSTEQLSSWNDNPQREFITSIVQPFVIVQETEVPHNEES